MKKTYITPSSTVFALAMENNLLLSSLSTNETDGETTTSAEDALSAGRGGWSCDNWNSQD